VPTAVSSLKRKMKKERRNKLDDDNRAFAPCPTCGNDDVDTLVWDDPDGGADFVTCIPCGTRYNPITGQLQRPF
jgi:transcription elongation factor Elf1